MVWKGLRWAFSCILWVCLLQALGVIRVVDAVIRRAHLRFVFNFIHVQCILEHFCNEQLQHLTSVCVPRGCCRRPWLSTRDCCFGPQKSEPCASCTVTPEACSWASELLLLGILEVWRPTGCCRVPLEAPKCTRECDRRWECIEGCGSLQARPSQSVISAWSAPPSLAEPTKPNLHPLSFLPHIPLP